MSQKSKLDPRAERSREWMRAALNELMCEKEYEKITITEITDRAGLSRPTFYLHYRTKDDLLLDHLDEIFERIVVEFQELKQSVGPDKIGPLTMTKLFEEIQKNAEIFKTMINIGAARVLLERFSQRFVAYLEDLAQRYEIEVNPEVCDLSAHYMAGSLVGLIYAWLQDEAPHSPEIMGEFHGRATRSFVRYAIRDKELDYIFK